MSAPASQVVIGMDPHKRTVTIEVMAADEAVLGGGRYGTDVDGRRESFAAGRSPTPGRDHAGVLLAPLERPGRRCRGQRVRNRDDPAV